MAERSPEFTQRFTTDDGRAGTMREQVRRGLEERPAGGTEQVRQAGMEERPELGRGKRTIAQNAALTMSIANLTFGVLGFVAPAVTGTSDKVINRSKGKLFDVFAINPPHALAHTLLGGLGIAAQRSPRLSERYLEAGAVAYAALAVAGIVKERNRRKGINEFLGLALNTADNVLHGVWGAACVALALGSQRLGRR